MHEYRFLKEKNCGNLSICRFLILYSIIILLDCNPNLNFLMIMLKGI